MKKVVVLGLKDEEGLWVADLEAGTVVPFAANAGDDMEDIRKSGSDLMRGVDLAVAINAPEAISTGYFG